MNNKNPSPETKRVVYTICGIIMAIALFLCVIIVMNVDFSSEETTSDTLKAESVSQKESKESISDNDVVIYEDDVLKAVYLGVSENFGFQMLNIHFENKSNSEITILPMDSSVNDTMIMFTSGMPATMQPGKKLNQAWIIGSDPARRIEFAMSICDEHMSEITKTGVIYIEVEQ